MDCGAAIIARRIASETDFGQDAGAFDGIIRRRLATAFRFGGAAIRFGYVVAAGGGGRSFEAAVLTLYADR
jgi:hypothetical protein